MQTFSQYPSYSITTLCFGLTIQHYQDNTILQMMLYQKPFTTASYPRTITILANSLPRVLQSTCFNDKQLPFRQEAQQTEIAHLFEHILLEYLCIDYLSTGISTATFKGLTSWDWKKEKAGTFHIAVNAGEETLGIFNQSLRKSITLLEEILASSIPLATPYQSIPANQAN